MGFYDLAPLIYLIPDTRRESSDEAKLRRNKTFTAIKQELADREKLKRKLARERTKRGKKNAAKDEVRLGVLYV